MAPSCAAPPFLRDLDRNKKSKPIKIFSGVGHGIKKPKPKKAPKTPIQKDKPTSTKSTSLRQSIKDKFDFSRTPYAIPLRRRVALSEECSKKRKFFKTTVEIETPQPKKPKLHTSLITFDFEDINHADVEPEFAEIKKDVYSILDEWNEEEESHFQPQMTRQKAGELPSLQTETTHLSLSYLTPSADRFEDSPKSTLLLTPSSERDFNSSSLLYSTPARNDDTPTSTRSVGGNQNKCSQIPHESDENSPENNLARLFSVFTTPPAKSVLSDVTNKNKKIKASLNKAAAPNDQLQIDAGQKVIGPVECSNCGMVYDVGDPVDEKRHADYHAKRHELKYKSSKSENVVGICGADRIILIKYSDEKKRGKIQQILKVTEEEIGCGYTWGPFSVAFIYVRNDRILGCLIAEPKVKANRVIPSDGIVLLSTESQIVKCGINRIWVKKEFRGNKIGTELLNCLRKNYVYGDYLRVDDIAFSATTPDGHAFAKKYTGRNDYLTYEEPTAR